VQIPPWPSPTIRATMNLSPPASAVMGALDSQHDSQRAAETTSGADGGFVWPPLANINPDGAALTDTGFPLDTPQQRSGCAAHDRLPDRPRNSSAPAWTPSLPLAPDASLTPVAGALDKPCSPPQPCSDAGLGAYLARSVTEPALSFLSTSLAFFLTAAGEGHIRRLASTPV
jgi:hypothetical protein